MSSLSEMTDILIHCHVSLASSVFLINFLIIPSQPTLDTMNLKRFFTILAILFLFQTCVSNAQSIIIFQNDTVYHSVVGRLVHGGAGYQNASWTKTLRIKDAYFLHQADSIFVCLTTFDWTNFDILPNGFSGVDFEFRSPKTATTTYDTLVMVCAYTDDTGDRMYVRRPYIGITTTDSSSDSNRVCLYALDCDYLAPINLGDTAHGVLCYDLEYIPYDSITITSIHFEGRDSASFHLVNNDLPISAYNAGYSERISEPYIFVPARDTGVKRYTATAIATMTSQDGVLCHEADIDVQGLLAVPDRDSIPVNLYGPDSLSLHFTLDSTIFKHVLEFKNNSSGAIKIDDAYMNPGNCFAMDSVSPPYGTRLDSGALFYVNLHYVGDSTIAGEDCSDTLYISAQNVLSILAFPMGMELENWLESTRYRLFQCRSVLIHHMAP